jgi:hypothetical protein
MLRCLVIAVLVLPGRSAGQETETSDLRRKVRHLLELTGGADPGARVLEHLRREIAAAEAQAPPEFVETWERLADHQALLDEYLDILEQHLDEEMVDAAIAFYESPVGQRYARALTGIESDCHEADWQWRQQLFPRVIREMLEHPARETPAAADPATNEERAIAALRRLSTAQAQFQASVTVDQDVDAIGEFGFLGELAGTCNYRTAAGSSSQPASPPFIPTRLGETAARDGGIATLQGYHLRVYLPGSRGRALADPGQAAPGDRADADLQEERFIAHAWPVEVGVTGQRCFVVTPAGVVFAAPNRREKPYSGLESVPAAGAAYDAAASQDPDNVDGLVRTGARAVDGQEWRQVGT